MSAPESDTAVFWNRTMKRRTARWFYIVASHFITGVSTAITTGAGTAFANSLGVAVQPLTPKQLLSVFLWSGVVGAAAYMTKNPMDKLAPDTTPPIPPEQHLR